MTGITFNPGTASIQHQTATAAASQARGQQAPQHPAAGIRESIRQGLQSLRHRFTDTLQRITHTGHYTPDKVFARQNPYVVALAKPPRPGENGFTDGGIMARHGEAIATRLETYRKSIGSKVSPQEMRALINTGEHLVNAINRGQVEGGTVRLTVEGQSLEAKSSLYTTRAISWYLMAKTAELEILQGGDHMVDKGTLMMRDEGNRLYNFLNAAPTSYGRVSTHFNERSDSPRATLGNVGLSSLIFRQPAHRGIEDFDNKLPSKSGALLFNKLQNEGLYMKFEAAGMPTVFRLSGENHHSLGQKVANSFRSLGRCLRHFASTVTSRFDHNSTGVGVHREHVHKDAAAKAVWQPFLRLTELLQPLSGDKKEIEALRREAKQWGIEFIERFVDNPAGFRLDPGRREEAAAALDHLRRSLDAYKQEQGSDFGIGRKGGETHISLETYPRELFVADRRGVAAPLYNVPLDD